MLAVAIAGLARPGRLGYPALQVRKPHARSRTDFDNGKFATGRQDARVHVRAADTKPPSGLWDREQKWGVVAATGHCASYDFRVRPCLAAAVHIAELSVGCLRNGLQRRAWLT